MKKNVPLAELSLEELKAKRNFLQGVAIGFGCVMLMGFAALVYLAVTSKNFALITVVIGGSLTFLPTIINLKQLNWRIR